MTKEAALHNFWSTFDLPAYEENAVPTGKDGAKFPYITYQVVTDSFGAEVALTASVWYYGTSWVEANAKAEEISRYISRGGKTIPVDGGALWLKRGTPFSQSMGDETDDLIKRKYLNITAEYLTAD